MRRAAADYSRLSAEIEALTNTARMLLQPHCKPDMQVASNQNPKALLTYRRDPKASRRRIDILHDARLNRPRRPRTQTTLVIRGTTGIGCEIVREWTEPRP